MPYFRSVPWSTHHALIPSVERFACLMLFGTWLLQTQTSATASIGGIVTDPSGAIITGAQVMAKDANTGLSRTVATDGSGAYRFSELAPGIYNLTAEAPNFAATSLAGVHLAVGQKAQLDFILKLGVVKEEIAVSENLAALDQSRTVLSQVIPQAEIESLPISSRNFVQFVQLTPKVLPTSAAASRGYMGERYRDTQFSFQGVRQQYNRETMDGGDATVFMANAVKSFYSLESVQEFRVASSLYTAEHGHAMGGVVNVITRSGTNDWHGALYEFFHNNRLDAPDFLSPAGLRVFRRNQIGASSARHLRKDKLFLFTNYEKQRQAKSPVLPAVFVSNLTAINTALTRLGYPRESLSVLPSIDSDQFLLRTDYVPGEKHRGMVRYNFFNSENPNDMIGTAGQLNDPVTPLGAHDVHVRDQALIANFYSFPSRAWVNHAGVGIEKHVFQLGRRMDVPAVELAVTGAFSTGQHTGLPSTSERRYHLFDNATWIHGRNELKLGAEYLHTGAALLNGPGSFAVIPGLQGLLAPKPAVLQLRLATWPPPHDWPKFYARQPGAYMQDQWKPAPNLTLNFGLRYDAELLSGMLALAESGRGNLQPRFGFAWSPGRALVIRGGLGIYTADRYHALMAIDALQHGPGFPRFNDAFLSANPWARSYRPLPDTATVLLFTDDLASAALLELVRTGSVSGGTPAQPTSAAEEPALPNPYARQWGVEFGRQLGHQFSVSVDYSGLQGRRLPVFVNRNLLPAIAKLPSGLNDYQGTGPNPRVYDPRFSVVSIAMPLGASLYNATTFSIRKAFGTPYALGLNYVFSKNIDNYGGIANNAIPQDPYNIDNDRSVSSEYAKHRLAAWLTAATPRRVPALSGFIWSFLFTANSPRYYNVTAGSDLNHDGNANTDRPDALGRNTFRGDDFMNLDMRVSRRFRIKERFNLNCFAEFYNLLNRVNITDFSTVYGAPTLALPPLPTFAAPRAAGNMFQTQLGVRLAF